MGSSNQAGIVTRVTAWLALAIEVFDFATKALKLTFFDRYHEGVEELGVLLFLVALVSWLEASNKGLAKLDAMGAELRALTEEARTIDWIARYGSSAVSLAHLLNPQGNDRTRFPHCRAGGATLSHLLLNTYTQAAEQFHRLRSGHTNEVKLTEASIINLFLKNLVESLPPGSVWLGTSRLQESDAWEKSTAEPGYYEFERAVEAGVASGKLTYLRVHCFESGDRHEQMTHIGDHQTKSGLQVRTLVGANLPDDMSLIWVPTSANAAKVDVADPVSFLERGNSVEPLCGLKFGIRADREVYSMALIDPNNQEFSTLKASFRHSWGAAA